RAEAEAGVAHHVVLSVVGTERLQDSGYFRAKQAQEELVRASGIPFSIVHATQFFEFLKGITDAATDGDTVRLAPVGIRPVHSDDVAAAVCRTALGPPAGGAVEVTGPESVQLAEQVRDSLAGEGDPRRVVADPEAPYFGARLGRTTLLPGPGARPGGTRIADWAARQRYASARPVPDPHVGLDVDGSVPRGVTVHRDEGARHVGVTVAVEGQAGPPPPLVQ